MKPNRIVDRIFSHPFRIRQAGWLKRALYVLVLVKCATLAIGFNLYFGANSMFPFKPHASGGWHEGPLLLYDTAAPGWSAAAIGLLALLCAVSLATGRLRLLTDPVIWFLCLNVHYKTYGMLTGGDHLLSQLLLFNVFLAAPSHRPLSPWRIYFHNAGLAAVLIQVCMVYAVSALAKLNDEEWRNGTALLTMSRVDHYRAYALQAWMVPPLWIAANYVVLAYQLLFPVLVWWRPVKRWVLAVGIVMHLYIALGMGLVTFGAVMIVAYLPFWPRPDSDAPPVSRPAPIA